MTAQNVSRVLLVGLLLVGCGDGDGGDGDAGTGPGPDGDVGGMDAGGGGGMDGAVDADGGGVTPGDGAVTLPDGRVVGGGPITCQGHLYQCGDTLDNDGDGLADDEDPDCLGPCDNNEAGFFLDIPGGDSAPCRLDCYFDQDQGSGNDQCSWDHRCDPLEPDPECMFRDPPPPSANCPAEQAPECAEICRPLVPNGCDCFGCCNLPAGTDRWVFIGSVDETGEPTCTLDGVEDDARCHPCTPVANCLNTCEECELCLGRTELPPECFPTPPPDGGTTLPDGGPVPDGGAPPPPLCDDGRQACGVPGTEPCPEGHFCLTGCCTFFG
ncbi:MAG: hypothetical protein VYE22_20530 [Myxococcota bacterium]|nr:hypothetical protein [Myxococcota bacterium]